ncbi:MAG: hypothetical protein IJH04_10915 [Eggerthellaceae bacterium]|nr:hypothetical protein [Eggerthellaceae bacterium]
MELTPGKTYHCELTASIPLVGSYAIVADVTVDSPTSFHGEGSLKEGSIKLGAFEIDDTFMMPFENGVIDGNNLSFVVKNGRSKAYFEATIEDDATISGTIKAGLLLNARISGTIEATN